MSEDCTIVIRCAVSGIVKTPLRLRITFANNLIDSSFIYIEWHCRRRAQTAILYLYSFKDITNKRSLFDVVASGWRGDILTRPLIKSICILWWVGYIILFHIQSSPFESDTLAPHQEVSSVRLRTLRPSQGLLLSHQLLLHLLRQPLELPFVRLDLHG